MITIIATYWRRKLFWHFIQGIQGHHILYSQTVSKNNELEEMTIFKIEGGITEGFEFHMDEDTEVVRSCSALLNGELFVFGGNSKKRQVGSKDLQILSILDFSALESGWMWTQKNW